MARRENGDGGVTSVGICPRSAGNAAETELMSGLELSVENNRAVGRKHTPLRGKTYAAASSEMQAFARSGLTTVSWSGASKLVWPIWP